MGRVSLLDDADALETWQISAVCEVIVVLELLFHLKNIVATSAWCHENRAMLYSLELGSTQVLESKR